MTEVINIRDTPKGWKDDPRFVYIGRERKGLSGYFGNPYPLIDEERRDYVLGLYKMWFQNKLKIDTDFRDRIQGLSDKTLVCFCKPKNCHGDVIKEYLDDNQHENTT